MQHQEPREGSWADGQSVAPPAGHWPELFCATALPWAGLVKPSQLRATHGQRRSLLCSCKCLGITSFYVIFQIMLHISVAVICMLGADLLGLSVELPMPWTATQRKPWHIKSSERALILLKNRCSEKHWQLTLNIYVSKSWSVCLGRKLSYQTHSLSLGSCWNSFPVPALTCHCRSRKQCMVSRNPKFPSPWRIQCIWPTA